MDIKKTKRNSFLVGLLVGAVGIGIIITVILFVIIGLKIFGNPDIVPGMANAGQTSVNNQTDELSEVIDDDVVKKINRMLTLIDGQFLFTENVDVDKMQTEIYSGIMESLDDPYSVYYTPEELADMFEESDGTYYGIGSYVTMDETRNLPMLYAIFEESPARDAGLRDGDIISEVDGESISGLTLTEVTSRIKGPEGTDVELTIIREGEADTLKITVTRGKVETPTVKHHMIDDEIGYLQITEFDSVTTDQFKEAYKDLQASDMKAMVIDLRSNPGGNLDTVLNICEEILPKGIITYTIDKQGHRVDYTGNGKTPIDIPLVVLVNGYSASASELMTGAIRDYKVGTIMGTNTFGKGIVQQIYTLKDGSGIKITTSRYYTPNGECIHQVGIAPDIEIELDEDLYYGDEKIDNQLDAAVDYLKEQLN